MIAKSPRAFLGALAFAVAVLALSHVDCRRVGGSSDSSPGPEPLVVGVVAPFYSSPGDGIRGGVAMAVAEINAAGGVLGRPLRVVEVDDEFLPSKSVLAYQRLAGSQKAVAVIGFAGSGVFPVMEQLSQYRVPVLCTGVGADRLTDMVRENPARYGRFFRIMHRSSDLAEVTSAFLRLHLYDALGVRRFAILAEDDAWTTTLREAWRAAISASPGARLVLEETFSTQTTDFAAVFSRLSAARAEYVLDASSRVPSALYLKRWAAARGPLIGAVPTGAGTRKYYEEVGPAGTGVCTVGTIPSRHNPLTRRAAAWHAAYTRSHGDPEYTSAYSYDAVYVLKQAIQAAGRADPDAVTQALERVDYAGVVGRYSFDASHQPRFGPGYRMINVLQYQLPEADGFRVIFPPDRAAAPFRYPDWWNGARRQ